MYKGTHPIAPSGRELSPQVTEGACGRETNDLLMGWYLIGSIKARGGTAPGSPTGYAPAGSPRLGASPQDTSLPEGGIYGTLLQGNDTGRKKAPLPKGAGKNL